MALFVDLAALSNGLHGSVQMDSVALFLWIGWLCHHGILTVFYRAISNENGNFDFNLNNIDSITQNHIKRFLLPVINSKEFFSLPEAKQKIIDFFNEHFVLNENESMFLDQFKQKNYMPELLYDGDELKRIKNHPMALWKTRTTKKL